MKSYDRLFGSGPLGLVLSVVLFVIAVLLKDKISLPNIFSNSLVIYTIFVLNTFLCLTLAFWGFKSLSPVDRGKKLCTSGAFKYFRHPLYASFLSFFDFGFAVLLNNYIYVIWALLMLPMWHWIIAKEEKLMLQEFQGDYKAYCARTGRFFPKPIVLKSWVDSR